MSEPEIKITPPGSISYNISEIWTNRELLYFFAWRDIKVKYKQTYLGILWALLQPLLLMAIFFLVFSRTLHMQVGMSYATYAFAGLVLWGFFSAGITNSSDSLLNSSQMIRKIYFPRILIPVASILVAFVDFLIGFIVLLIILLLTRQPVSWQAIYLFPVAILITCISSFGIGTFLSALNIKYRDFRYLLPFTMQLLFFSSQVVYSIDSIQQTWLKYILYCNPLNGALELFHYPMKNESADITGILISITVAIIFLISGLFYFKKTEAYLADIV